MARLTPAKNTQIAVHQSGVGEDGVALVDSISTRTSPSTIVSVEWPLASPAQEVFHRRPGGLHQAGIKLVG